MALKKKSNNKVDRLKMEIRSKYKEISVMFMEKQNWFIKISKFLNRKFT